MTRNILLAGFAVVPIAANAGSTLPVPPIPPQPLVASLGSSSAGSSAGAFSAAPMPNADLFPPKTLEQAGPQLMPSISTPPQRPLAVGEAFVPGSKIPLPDDRKNPLAPGISLKLPLE